MRSRVRLLVVLVAALALPPGCGSVAKKDNPGGPADGATGGAGGGTGGSGATGGAGTGGAGGGAGAGAIRVRGGIDAIGVIAGGPTQLTRAGLTYPRTRVCNGSICVSGGLAP